MSLSILIPTYPERQELFDALWNELNRQGAPYGEEVEIHSKHETKLEMPIGVKRNALLALAQNAHVLFFDDDDWPYPHYLQDIMEALKTDPDCVGCVIDMTTNGGNPQRCVHSLQFKRWRDGRPGEPYDFYRNVTHRNAVRTSIARKVGFPDIRFGEDQPYSNGVTRLCRTEVFIERPGFVYRYSTAEPHAQKYGIR